MSNKSALTATVIVAIIAVTAVIFAIIIYKDGDKTKDSPSSTESDGNANKAAFIPSEELEDEMYDAATQLVSNNFEVFNLFYRVDYFNNPETVLFEEEPYGNVPEDGYLSLIPGFLQYKNADEIFDIVRKTYVGEVAETIIGFSSQTENGDPVYKERNGRIGINITYKPIELDEYSSPNGDIAFTIEFISETKGIIKVDITESVTKELVMIKNSDGVWLLENIVY